MKVLLLHSNRQTREMIAFSLESKVGASVHSVASVHEAFDYLIEDNSIHLIVFEDTELLTKLYKYLLSVDSEIPCILIKGASSSNVMAYPDLKLIGEVTSTDVLEQLPQLIAENVSLGTIQSSIKDHDYCRIRTELLIMVVPLKSDVYVKLSELKFIKLFKKGDTFDSKDFVKYFETKKIEYLYIKKSDCNEFILKFKTALSQVLTGEIKPSEVPRLVESSHEAVVSLSQKLGFTPEIQELVTTNVQAVIKGIRVNKTLSEICSDITQSTNKYISSHSVLLAHISCLFATRLSWYSDSTLEKLCYASFLHDISLQNPKIAMIETLTDLESNKDNFTSEEIEQYKNHPYQASELAKKFKQLPGEVDQIILQHHETHDGSGFPKGLNSKQISPLGCVFIIAHNFANEYLKTKSFDEAYDNMLSKYNTGNFKKIVDSVIRADNAKPLKKAA